MIEEIVNHIENATHTDENIHDNENDTPKVVDKLGDCVVDQIMNANVDSETYTPKVVDKQPKTTRARKQK